MRFRSIGIAALAPLAVVGLWLGVVVLPTGSSANDLQDRLDASDAELGALALVLEDSRTGDAQLVAMNAQLEQLSSAVPATPDIAGFIRLVHTLAADSGTIVSSVTPQAEQQSTAAVATTVTSVSLSLEGDFAAVMAFLDDLLSAQRLVRVDSVDLAADDSTGSLFVELVVSIHSEPGNTNLVGELLSQADRQVDDAATGLTLEANN